MVCSNCKRQPTVLFKICTSVRRIGYQRRKDYQRRKGNDMHISYRKAIWKRKLSLRCLSRAIPYSHSINRWEEDNYINAMDSGVPSQNGVSYQKICNYSSYQNLRSFLSKRTLNRHMLDLHNRFLSLTPSTISHCNTNTTMEQNSIPDTICDVTQ